MAREARPQLDAAQLHQLYVVERRTVREIARMHRLRIAAVLAAMDAAGIARRRPGQQRKPPPDWDSEKLQQLVRVNGLPYARAFARRYGVSRHKLAGLLGTRALDRGRRSRQIVIEHDAAIRSAYDEGASVKSLAAKYGCTRRAISYSLDRTSGGNKGTSKPAVEF